MKEKTKLRVIQILCIVSLLITVFSIQRTYAKYFEKVDTRYATNIKKWIIKVNGTDIHDETELNSVMMPRFFYNEHMDTNGDLDDSTNENPNNILVPGREGYFDFLINYENVEVPFKFQFDIKQLNTKTIIEEEGESQTITEIDNYLEDLEVYGYAIIEPDLEISGETTINDIDGIQTLTKDANGKYLLSGLTQQIDPTTDSERLRRILILFRWNDENKDTIDENDEQGMNNIEDTLYTGENIEGDSIHTNLKYNIKVTFTQQFE